MLDKDGGGTVDLSEFTQGMLAMTEALSDDQFDKGFNSSPIVVGDRVYITDMSGTTQIFRMGKKFELMGTASVNEAVYATPAFSGDQIFVRGLTHLYCIKNQE